MEFSMSVADPVKISEEIIQEKKVTSEKEQQLQEQAKTNALAIMNCDTGSVEQKREFSTAIDSLGAESMRRSSTKNELLKVTIGNLSRAGDEGGSVAKSLLELQRELKDLDPSFLDFTKQGVLGKIFNPIRDYFARYEKSESVIANIIESLEKGKTTLKNDNTSLSIEEGQLSEMTISLNSEIELGKQMDSIITEKLAEARAQGLDPNKIRFIEEEILFPLRQRVMDMSQMVVVNHQGIIAMEIVQRNNKELIRGIDRANTVTISALRTAVMVAGALYNQKIVLKKIDSLNKATNTLIANTSKMLKEQGGEVARQSMESNISIDVLKQSFADCMAALHTISTYKQEALPKMQQSIAAFRALADEGEKALGRLK